MLSKAHTYTFDLVTLSIKTLPEKAGNIVTAHLCDLNNAKNYCKHWF